MYIIQVAILFCMSNCACIQVQKLIQLNEWGCRASYPCHFCGGGKNGLVQSVGACAIYSVKSR